MNPYPGESMQLGLIQDGRLVCMAAGDVFQAARREIRSALREARGDRFEAIDVGLARLRDQGQITQTDQEQVSALVQRARTVTGEAGITAETAQQLGANYRALAGDRRSSPVALAIASILNSLVTTTELVDGDDGVSSLVGISERAENVIVGAIVGGLLGFVIGGVPGAVGGAAAGANAGACTPTDEPS